jgi:hypothetical protein
LSSKRFWPNLNALTTHTLPAATNILAFPHVFDKCQATAHWPCLQEWSQGLSAWGPCWTVELLVSFFNSVCMWHVWSWSCGIWVSRLEVYVDSREEA